ncbi:MAG: ABC transporter permease [Rhodobacterales bacterium]
MQINRMGKNEFSFFKWLGFIVAVIVSIISAVLGYLDETPSQLIILYTVGIFGLIVWGWHHLSVRWIYNEKTLETEKLLTGRKSDNEISEESEHDLSYFSILVKNNRLAIVGILAMIIVFIALAFGMKEFLQWQNVLSLGVFFLTLLVLIVTNTLATFNKSALMGLAVLIGLFIMGSLIVDGFISTLNLKSMLLFASFLGLACIGQTLVVLLGGLDLSVSFVIGASNIGLMYLITLGLPPWICIIAVLLVGAGVGFINGLLSFRLQGQALIITLGVGFVITGGVQALTTIGSDFGGSVFGVVPKWLANIAATNGTIVGISIPPIVVIWIAFSIILIIALKNTTWGRNLYALGGNRTAAARLSISERFYWIGAFSIGGLVSAFTGILLLGWSGGGFVGVGGPYLFQTIAAVVVGGSSLLGGKGGYGFTVIGVLVLQVLSSFLVGIGLSYEGQQFVFGLLILPMVALYARSPHIRTQI